MRMLPFPRSLAPGRLALAALAVLSGAALLTYASGFWLRFLPDERLLSWAEARPADVGLSLLLARRLWDRGEPEAAAAALERVTAEAPGDLAARRELARALVTTGRTAEALPHLREIVRRAPRDAFAQEKLGEYYRARGAISWAVEAYRIATESRTAPAGAWAGLGECYLHLHQPAQARDAWQRAVTADPDQSEYRLGLGRALLEGGETARAEAVFKECLEAVPAAAYWLARACLLSPAREGEALRWLDAALAREPHAVEAAVEKARLLLRRGRPAAAAPILEHAARDHPAPEVLYLLARAYREAGREDDARRCLQRFENLASALREQRQREIGSSQSPGGAAPSVHTDAPRGVRAGEDGAGR